MVLEDGAIGEQGTHHQLVRRGGRYAGNVCIRVVPGECGGRADCPIGRKMPLCPTRGVTSLVRFG